MKKRRNTKQRQAILDCLNQAHSHLSADELLLRVQKVVPSVNAATLYRNLHVLEETNDIKSLSIGGKTFFETSGPLHHHFYCRACERLISIEASAMHVPSTEAIRATSGFQAESVSVVVEGVCALCSPKTKEVASEACKTCLSLCQNVISDTDLPAVPCRNV